MTMQLFLQQIVEGLSSGAIYASLAVALVLIYRATRIVNFAQGEMATFTAYIAWQLNQWGVPFWLCLLITGVLAFILGALVFRLVIRPVITASENTIVVMCIGLFIGFEALSLWIWGADSYAFPRLFPEYAWTFGGVRVTATNVGILATLCVLAAGLIAMFKFTRLGLAMRASAAERDKSPLVGIRVETMLMFGWGLATVAGFVAAVLVAPSLFLSPPMMVAVVIYALAAATLGGWDSLAGAIVGGLFIGVAESLGATYVKFIGSELKVGIPFALMAIVLLVRPQGLFGRTAVIRV
jgi:branched-chain amino acid transport system permease protein